MARLLARTGRIEGTPITETGTIASGTWEGTDVAVAHGGTGASTLTANNVLLGNGTAAPLMIAPGADGQVLTSTGSTWQSEAAAGGGGAFVKTGSVAWAASATAKDIDDCFSATYGAYWVFGSMWNRTHGGGYGIYMRLKSAAGALSGSNYSFGETGRTFANVDFYGGGEGVDKWTVESAFEATAGYTLSFALMFTGTHEADANTAFTGTSNRDRETTVISGEHITEGTTMTGLSFIQESTGKIIDGWVNVYGIVGDYS